MITIWRAFAGITAGLVLLMTALSPSAQSAPASHRELSVCDTGFRGQPDYDRMCLIIGDYYDAKNEWRGGFSLGERKAQCRTALRTGMPAMVRETRGDVLYDTYSNNETMVRLTAWAGAAECYRI